jgi:hypothetical protein
MNKIIFLIIFILSSLALDGQVYRQSYVDANGNVVTNYYYPNMPGQPDRGRPTRVNGRIVYQNEHQPYIPPPYNSRPGGPYRDASGKIRYN